MQGNADSQPVKAPELRLVPVGHALSMFLVITFVLCVLWGLATPPALHMHRAWEALLPGFEWLSWKSFFYGLVGAYLYGWYTAAVLVPLYRFFARRRR